MKTLITAFLLIIISCAGYTQSCNPPTNVTLYIDEYWFTSFLDWWPPVDGCDVITYEVEYGYGPFTPGTGEGISYGYIEFPFAEFFDPYVTTAWIRSICDCEGGEGGNGDGEADTDGAWVNASVFYIPPPEFPDEGLYCEFAPTVNVFDGLSCGSSYYDLYFSATFEWDGIFEIPCGDGSEFVLWRHFVAPPIGEVEITISSDIWGELGYALYEGECDGELITCEPSVNSGVTSTVSNLIPGNTYVLGSWNVNFPYYLDEWGPNGTLNFLEICEPEVACYPPTDVVIEEITDQAAYVSWSANEATQWDIEYGPAGFSPGEGLTINDVTTNFIWLEDLDPETEYDVYLVANCLDLGFSPWSGPNDFSTNPSIWLINEIEDGYAFCCDEFDIAESFDVGSYCEPLTFAFEDEIEGPPCNQLINRTIVATDDCGNQVQVEFDFAVYDNGFECGCESGYQIPDNDDGRAVAIYGEWAIQENGLGDRVMRLVDGEWTLAGALILGTNFHNTLQMYDDVFVSFNNVYRLNDDEWTMETTLISSLGDEEATVAAIHGQTIALEMGEQIFLFEEIDGEWVEVAMFEQSCYSLDLAEDVLVASGAFDEAIAKVFRKTDGVWSLEQDLMPPPNVEGWDLGYEVEIDGTHLAVGNRYLGGISIFEYDGAVWQSEGFMMNPNLYSDFGYFTAFGSAIDIEGDLMIVGDNMNQPNGVFSGTVTVFERACGEWQFHSEIVPIDGQSGHRFGGCLDFHDGNLLVGIDDTYWLGGNPYNGQGKFWFIPCIESSPNDFSFSVSPGGTLTCDQGLPDPDFEIGLAWCDSYEISMDTTGTLNCGEDLVRTFTISNGDITETAEQVFNFQDNVAPVAYYIPPDVSIECDGDFPADSPGFEDNCSSMLDITFSQDTIGDGCSFEVLRNWTATDDCGNQTVVTQTVNVVSDSDAPAVDFAPVDEQISCGDSFSGVAPIFSDNCSNGLSITIQEDSIAIPNCGYEIIKTWTATDECGNETTVEQTLTLVDDVAPTFDCPDGQVYTLNSEAELFPVPDYLAGITTLEDDCDENPNIEQSPGIGILIEPGSTIIRIVATDQCGNATVCEFEIIVEVVISIDEHLEEPLLIFPNPAHTQISFTTNYNVMAAEVFGMDGKLVCTYTGYPPYDIESLASGNYRIRARLENGGIVIGNFIKN